MLGGRGYHALQPGILEVQSQILGGIAHHEGGHSAGAAGAAHRRHAAGCTGAAHGRHARHIAHHGRLATDLPLISQLAGGLGIPQNQPFRRFLAGKSGQIGGGVQEIALQLAVLDVQGDIILGIGLRQIPPLHIGIGLVIDADIHKGAVEAGIVAVDEL